MPRRKVQFSLLTLFVFITLCAVGLGWWFSRPPQVTALGPTGYSLYQLPEGEFQAATVQQYAIRLDWPTRSRWQGIMFIGIHDTRCHPMCSVGSGVGPIRVQVGSESNGTFLAAKTTEINCELMNGRILWNGQEMACPPNSAIVARYDCKTGWHVTVDDGTFKLPELEPRLAEKLRYGHILMLEQLTAKEKAAE